MRWFRNKLADPNCAILLAKTREGRPVGQLRLDLLDNGAAQVSISVAPACRGRGIGTAMLLRLPGRIGKRKVAKHLAFIRPDNVSSAIAFLKAGFRFAALERVQGVSAYRLERRNP